MPDNPMAIVFYGRLLGRRMNAAAHANRAMSGAERPRLRSPLFRKYVVLIVAVVCVALLINGLLDIWFSYQENMSALVRVQREQAVDAAEKVTQFVKDIEDQVGWTTQLPWPSSDLKQRRFDALRLLHQVPAITELALLDPNGHEQLHVSRLAVDIIGSNRDLSKKPEFTEAIAHRVYYGPVYFRRQSEPYMTLALAGTRREDGVSVVEVNLKLIWDLVSHIKVGKNGDAYVIDPEGRLIAHRDISLVLRNTDMSGFAQVQAARSAVGASGSASQIVQVAKDIEGRTVLTAYAPVTPMGWTVFVELPVAEAYEPLRAPIIRSGFLLLGALTFAGIAGFVLAHRMVGPIRALQTGAARIGGGDLTQRISIKTGDELEALADQFNEMGGRLQESYNDLENKVEVRTHELAQSVQELRALGEVSQAVNSTLDLPAVLSTIVAKAVQLSQTEAGAIYVYDEQRHQFELRATHGMDGELLAAMGGEGADLHGAGIGAAVERREFLQIADLRQAPRSPLQQASVKAGFSALLAVPLLRPNQVVGALVVRRRRPGVFAPAVMELLQTFADQSVIAIQNARLFAEIEEKSRQLEIVSRHKSQFLANMSHELRTPLNAILGYTELVLDSIYGTVPERMRSVLDRVQSNGRHLLGLINDVLDLSKIEAGQMTLLVESYSLDDVLRNVLGSVEPLAAEKHLVLKHEIQPYLPMGHGDQRRIAQVLLNLIGNAIKFTDQGEVAVEALEAGGSFLIAVSDTGPGIAAEEQEKIFEEFHQADNSATRTKSGTGLGLSIAKRIIEMHDGHISVESTVGEGSTFRVILPVNVRPQTERT
jgi:signal transduction histidine kinase